MNKDKLDSYIEYNRDELDTDLPPEGMWDAIEQGLEEEPENERGKWFFTKIAATLILLVLGGFLVPLLFTNEHVEPELSELGQRLEDRRNNPDKYPDFRPENVEGYVAPEPEVRYLRVKKEELIASADTDLGGSEQLNNIETVTPFLDLGAATYNVVVTDQNGCLNSYTYSSNTTSPSNLADYSYSWTPTVNNKNNGIRGNVGEYDFSHDLNPNYRYIAEPTSSEQYDRIFENGFNAVIGNPLSTFSIDVDRAGYSNMRRFINQGSTPPKDAIKIEEMINYFHYDYEQPKGDDPLAISTEMHPCPWNPQNKLLKVGLKAKDMELDNLPASNLVFLIDVSGSMSDDDKLPLLKKGFELLVDQLCEEDRVAIVVYAGSSGLVLPSTSGANKGRILNALNQLESGGSTAGGEGIELAYRVARQHFKEGGNNRIILATDGDFNVGASSDEEMVNLIEEKRKSGVFLSVLGFGTGNLQSSKMEKIADNGNGNYSYIDSEMEAKKVFVTELGGTLYTLAKDVKLQLEFNPKQVKSYRLIGYENRMLAAKDFADDTKDAGEMGAGHTVTALYELVPATDDQVEAGTQDLKYQKYLVPEELKKEVLTIKFRYKQPDGDKSKLITYTMKEQLDPFMSQDFAFASAVAQFGLLMRDSQHRGNATYNNVLRMAYFGKGEDKNGYRMEFIRLVEEAKRLNLAP